jgi:hypothetical protein
MGDPTSVNQTTGVQPATAPTLRGSRFRLVPVHPVHYATLYEIAILESVSFRWRYRGNVPTYEQFVQSLTGGGALCQFAVVPLDGTSVEGLVVAYNASFHDSTAFVAILSTPGVGSGIVEAMFVFVDYLLTFWPLRKLYFEMPAFNLAQFESAVRLGILTEEARLRDYHYYQDRYWDKVILSVNRDDARKRLTEFGAILGRPSTEEKDARSVM